MDEILKDRPRYLFLRDDDVSDTRPRFLAAFELCAQKDIPVVYAVIPQRIKKRLVTFLRSPARLRPALPRLRRPDASGGRRGAV